MKTVSKIVRRRERGIASVEQVVLVVLVGVTIAAAIVPIGAVLFDYHKTIEFILALPVP